MSKKNQDPWYRQCCYETPLPDGSKKVGTSWIPETLAKVGKPIYFGKKNEPRKLWTITEVGGRRRESYLLARRMAYKFQRGMSDI